MGGSFVEVYPLSKRELAQYGIVPQCEVFRAFTMEFLETVVLWDLFFPHSFFSLLAFFVMLACAIDVFPIYLMASVRDSIV